MSSSIRYGIIKNQTRGRAKYEGSTNQHALAYLIVANNLPHHTEGESVLVDHITKYLPKLLNLGTAKSR